MFASLSEHNLLLVLSALFLLGPAAGQRGLDRGQAPVHIRENLR